MRCRPLPMSLRNRLYSFWSSSGLLLAGCLFWSACTIPKVAAQEPAADTKEAHFRELKDLDGHFPFTAPETLAAWESRAQELRMQLRVSLGLFPMPKLAPALPTVHSRQEMDGYAVENVYFESLPGLYVTGNLYTPLGGTAPAAGYPAVLSPHGHWANGRFYKTNDAQMQQELATGGERFESAARSPLQARCVQMARMGIVVFHYDMLGYADSQQISMDRVHGFGLHGPNPAVEENQWLLYSPIAEGFQQNVLGLQTLNTLQSLNVLLTRPDVDAKRISITGASGGGTQTFLASAIDPRFCGAYPVVMVSTSMQGGCTCENASGLRVNTGNVEIAALTAPKPMGMNAANDWTRDMATDGFPELKKLYGLYGAESQVSLHVATHFGHNYNHVTRVPMYGFMNKLFGLGLPEPVLEQDFDLQSEKTLSVWNPQHPAPRGGIAFEAELLKRWADDVQQQVAGSESILREGWQALLRPAEYEAKQLSVLEVKPRGEGAEQPGRKEFRIFSLPGMVGRWVMQPTDSGQIQNVRIVSQFEVGSLATGESVLMIDDAWHIDHDTSVQSLVKNPRPAACYTYGYNPPLLLRKLAVLLAAVDATAIPTTKGATWIAEDSEAVLLTAASAMRKSFDAVQSDPKGFDFAQVADIRNAMFLPGALRFGGMQGLQRVAAMQEGQ